MDKWIRVKISDLGQVVGGATPSTKKEEYYNGDIAWITPKDLSDFKSRYISRGERNITKAGMESCSTQLLPKNTILFSSRAPIGYVAIAENEMCTNQGFKSVIPNENVDYLFLYYLLKYNKDKIESMGSGTTFKEVSGSTMRNMQVMIPESKDVQIKIAAILDSIDSKIENNQKINDNLFHLATALFNQTITENNDALSIKIISEIADVKGGKRLPKGINLQITPNDHPYIRVRDLNDASIVQLTPNFEYVDDETYKGISRYIVHTSDVIVSIVGTIGLTALIHESLDNANLTENCVKITNLKEVSPEYLLLFLRSTDGQNAIRQGTVGAVQAKLPIKNIQSIPVPLIPEPQRNHLNDQLRAMFLSIAANLSENAYLIKIRDSLLPRLMSGEVNISDI